MTRPRSIWTDFVIADAARIFAASQVEGFNKSEAWRAIRKATGFSVEAIAARFYAHGPTFGAIRREYQPLPPAPDNGRPSNGALRLSEQQVADRDARAAAADRRTYTQQFFGDPPPGYSALERGQR